MFALLPGSTGGVAAISFFWGGEVPLVSNFDVCLWALRLLSVFVPPSFFALLPLSAYGVGCEIKRLSLSSPSS